MTGQRYRTHVRPRMGTLLAVTVPATRDVATTHCVENVFAVAQEWERVMSRHDPGSALSRLNRAAGQRGGVVSRALAFALTRARSLARRTSGCFDPTAAPILDAWRRAARRRRRPSARMIEAARVRVGWPGIQVRGTRVMLARAGMAVDLGAIGKGLVLDRIAGRMGHGATPALLNFGESSLRPVGRIPGRGWPVVLRHPWGGFAGQFRLRDRACSTSGTHGQTVGRERRSHIVDPRSGRPLSRRAQVTVLAPSATLAEALSTALLVAGRRAMPDFTTRVGADACWIAASGIYTTPGFPLRRWP